jgi:hypothetical protein
MLGLLLTATQTLAQIQSVFGSFSSSASVFGNFYNYWYKGPGGTFDLAQSNVLPVTTPKTVPMLGSRQRAIIEPTRTALVVIDMQNFFLHPSLALNGTAGRVAVQPTIDMVYAFRKAGM